MSLVDYGDDDYTLGDDYPQQERQAIIDLSQAMDDAAMAISGTQVHYNK